MVASGTSVTHDAGLLPVAEPFDFGRSLRFLGSFPPTRGDQLIGEASLTRAISRGGVCAAVRVEQEAEGLRCTVRCAHELDHDAVAAYAARIADVLSTEDELAPFYRLAEDDPPFGEVVSSLHGLHHVKFPSLAEAMCWSVLGVRVPMAAARTMRGALVARYGRSITVDGSELWAFPEPADLAGATAAELTALLGNAQRAGYLANVCEALPEADELFLRTAPYDEAEAWLRQIKGVGEFAAALVLVRGLGRMDHRPVETREMLAAAERIYGRARPLGEIAEHYGAELGYWGFYARNAGGAASG